MRFKLVESPRKRKATGPQPAAPAPTTQARNRSPPFTHQSSFSTLSNPPPGRRRGHSRQRSDISSYRPIGRGRGEGFGPYRGPSPGFGTPREGAAAAESSQHVQQPRSGAHSVSSLLSDQPASPRFTTSEMRTQQQQQQQQRESERRSSPGAGGSDDKSRGGATGPVASRE